MGYLSTVRIALLPNDFQQLQQWIQTKYGEKSFWMQHISYQRTYQGLILFGWDNTEWYAYDTRNPEYEEVRDIMEFIRNCPAFYLRIGEADGDVSVHFYGDANRSSQPFLRQLFGELFFPPRRAEKEDD